MRFPVVTSGLGSPRRRVLGCVLLGLSLACAVDGDDAQDSAESAFAGTVPDCTRNGDLNVELGEGEDGFVAIPTGGQPTLHHGAQGGTHLVLAARLVTPDPLDRYNVAVTAEAGQEPCSGGECSTYATIGSFDGVVEGLAQIEQIGPTELEIRGLFLLVDNWFSTPVRRLTIEVSDACDRKAVGVRSFDVER